MTHGHSGGECTHESFIECVRSLLDAVTDVYVHPCPEDAQGAARGRLSLAHQNLERLLRGDTDTICDEVVPDPAVTSRLDADPNAHAWARRKIRNEIQWCDRMLAQVEPGSSAELAELVRNIRYHRHRLATALIGGQGCIIAAFDHRRAALQEQQGGPATDAETIFPAGLDSLLNEFAELKILTGSLAGAATEIYERGHRASCNFLLLDQECSCDYQMACGILLAVPRTRW